MRRPIVIGNWKMNMLISTANEWVIEALNKPECVGTDIIIAPPFTSLAIINQGIKGSRIKLAGQNMSAETTGQQTGEVSGGMLEDAGCDYVILGHSERRQLFGETDQLINKKILAACELDLGVIFCIGESIEDRNNGESNRVIEKQLSIGLEGVNERKFTRIIIAYEPIWAIGTGNNAKPSQAQGVNNYVRAYCEKLFSTKLAEMTRIVYGGSVNSQNSRSLMEQPDIDGLLVGGASLNAETFFNIINTSFESVN
jgi:triosephosphate isomerase (TIM)